jgi:hypothetical protein
MWRTEIGVLLIVHGVLHIFIWSPRASAGAPMDTGRSWLLGDKRVLSLTVAITAGVLIAAAGFGFLSDQAWWSMVGLAGGVLSLGLFGLFFTPWWLVGIAISAGLVVASLRAGIPA